jgi:hypothetical protein
LREADGRADHPSPVKDIMAVDLAGTFTGKRCGRGIQTRPISGWVVFVATWSGVIFRPSKQLNLNWGMDGWIGYTYIGTSTVAKCLGQCTVSRTQVATSAHYEKQGSIFLLSLPVRNVRLLNEIFSRACDVRIALRKERVMITWLANKP